MDVIKSFNQELSSLYNTKPPISKAKITTITRLGIKAIKFYKHVVQSVEKFIMKCKPEYKVPALYVIDSLVRQSKHQFHEKDVFGPRFAQNLKTTFYNLYQVSPDDKGKIIRVLNLWQKNEVFSPDVIHPLFEMADSKHPLHQEIAEFQAKSGVDGPSGSSSTQITDRSISKPTNQSDLLQQLHNIQSLLQNSSNEKDSKVKFDGKLLDFDYGEEDHEEERHQTASNALSNILSNPEVLKQLQYLQTQKKTQIDKKSTELLQMNHQKRELEMAIQEKEFDKQLAAALPNLPFASVCDLKPEKAVSASSSLNYFNLPPPPVFPNMNMTVPPPSYQKNEQTNSIVPPPIYQKKQPIMDFDERVTPFVPTVTVEPEIIDLDNIESDSDDRPHHRKSHRSRSSSRLQSSKCRSRSRSSRRHRSRSHDREEKVERHFDKEKEGERRRKCLPTFKKNHLAVCSTTLWVGHLSKLVQEEELSDAFGEFGDVVSINLIPPRGCAFVMMNRRQDAARAMYKLKNSKLQGKVITLAWAPGKGMKDKEWKDYWEVQDGVSYIPYKLLNKEIDYDYLEDGGVFDEDTVPLWLKDHLKSLHKKREEEMQNDTETSTVSSTTGDVVLGTNDATSSSFISLPPEVPLQSSTPPIAPAVPVTSKDSVLPLASPPPMASHLLMPPFGIPGLRPMGMAVHQPPLMPNMGVPPPNMFNMHHQLLTSVPPPPRNPFNQNMPDFPNNFLPLPFPLQHPQ